MAYLTEAELVDRFRYYTDQIESQLVRGDDFHALTDKIPFSIHLNAPTDLALRATNHPHTQLLGYQLEEIHELGEEFFTRAIHPASLSLYPQLLGHSKRNPSATMSFIHHVWQPTQVKAAYTPVVTFTKPTTLPCGGLLCLSPLPHNFGSMVDKVQQVIEVNEFKLKNFARFKQLSVRELEVLRLLGEGCNNPQTAAQLGISRQTVETHRKKIKAKLDISSFRDLVKYALAFGLIKL